MKAQIQFLSIVLCATAFFFATAQTPEALPPGARGIQSQAFKVFRDPANSPMPAPPKPSDSKVGGPKVLKPPPMPAPLGDTFLGLTLWRMIVAPESAQVKSRGFIHPILDKSGTKDWTAERITLARTVHERDWIRFTLESAAKGYLYVLNRDVFADGTQSDPVLIFPTTRIRKGNNAVEPGHPIQIPDPADDPPGLQVDLARPNQNGILLILIVTRQPLPEIRVTADQQKIPEALLKGWEKQWATNVEVSSDPLLEGQLIKLREQTAATDPAKPLGPADSVPVTLFHRRGPSGQPIYVNALVKLAH